ncbi:MAG TPA: hypothetical protein VEJ20_09985, partial [Candidatus Eremiobacteraceae bacterium]|nr:hypothetical protein [Candidatus Eremiobacteraceae bacterium]
PLIVEPELSPAACLTAPLSPSGTVPGCFVNQPNISFSFYRRLGHDELYVVYGNPNAVTTSPALIVKYIHYFGAEKGT